MRTFLWSLLILTVIAAIILLKHKILSFQGKERIQELYSPFSESTPYQPKESVHEPEPLIATPFPIASEEVAFPVLTEEATLSQDLAIVVINQPINVRNGPGTNYSIIGAAQQGVQFEIKGKDPTGTWWQVDYDGQNGWLFGQLVTAKNTSAVAIAQNIPTPLPPTATPIPQPTQPPGQPTQPPAPSTKYKFNIVVISKCKRQSAGNWFEGTTYVGGQPANGYKVVFSDAPDAVPITTPVISGPHPGYPGWEPGYYRHIINAASPKAADWYVWIVDDNGVRISEIGKWTSTGPDEGCNQAVVDFDSR